MDPQVASSSKLDALPLELFENILRFLAEHVSSSEYMIDAAALRCTNTHLAAMATHALFQNAQFWSPNEVSLNNFLLFRKSRLGRFVRTLQVRLDFLGPTLGDHDWYDCFVNLEDLTVDGNCTRISHVALREPQILSGFQEILCSASKSLMALVLKRFCSHCVQLLTLDYDDGELTECLLRLDVFQIEINNDFCQTKSPVGPLLNLLEAIKQVSVLRLSLNGQFPTTSLLPQLYFPFLRVWDSVGLDGNADADLDFLIRHELTLKHRVTECCHLTGNKTDFFRRLAASTLRLESFVWRDSRIAESVDPDSESWQPMDDVNSIANYLSLCELRNYEFTLGNLAGSEPDANLQLEQVIMHGLQPCLQSAVIQVSSKLDVDLASLQEHLDYHFAQARISFELVDETSSEGFFDADIWDADDSDEDLTPLRVWADSGAPTPVDYMFDDDEFDRPPYSYFGNNYYYI